MDSLAMNLAIWVKTNFPYYLEHIPIEAIYDVYSSPGWEAYANWSEASGLAGTGGGLSHFLITGGYYPPEYAELIRALFELESDYLRAHGYIPV